MGKAAHGSFVARIQDCCSNLAKATVLCPSTAHGRLFHNRHEGELALPIGVGDWEIFLPSCVRFCVLPLFSMQLALGLEAKL